MKLQLALDDISLVDALVLAEKVRDYVDIFEIGSPFIIQEGMRAVREFRRYFPEKKILADTKIMDAGEYEAELTFKAGADYCTVLGVTDILTIKACLAAAKKYGKQVFVDTICVPDLNTRIKELEDVGVDSISVHVGVDEQAVGQTPLNALKQVKQLSKHSHLSVAGGIKVSTVDQYQALGADIIIVGGGVNHADDPVATAKALADKIHSHENVSA
ncbi:3-hexulose-6-phosphate synthase [Lacticaseibacillus paracasei]|uniref:3-hexulose-6-phosphate synthase n=1 Tax=Lacticaseibacillus paracasei TaxID=1597 RepID=UPI000F439229|nr:3-hexulose-6-phosphate synthase [Lacticaseibacillus paracasei]RNE04014.1 3-hexulose-6-phosphate synthase [Lacticaseibacillus paracasei]RNE24738.1 3-hexulose-6-phosphate synthase [Lacticaseibacillus paracasei]